MATKKRIKPPIIPPAIGPTGTFAGLVVDSSCVDVGFVVSVEVVGDVELTYPIIRIRAIIRCK